MRWPWTKVTKQREVEAERRAEEARRDLERLRATAEDLDVEMARAHKHSEVNGWNRIAQLLIDGGPR